MYSPDIPSPHCPAAAHLDGIVESEAPDDVWSVAAPGPPAALKVATLGQEQQDPHMGGQGMRTRRRRAAALGAVREVVPGEMAGGSTVGSEKRG